MEIKSDSSGDDAIDVRVEDGKIYMECSDTAGEDWVLLELSTTMVGKLQFALSKALEAVQNEQDMS
jgi:hypothetical protein